MMKKKLRCRGFCFMVLFVVWTYLIQVIDVQIAGESQTQLGFATMNLWGHQFTGVHLWLYIVTDWMSIIPVIICVIFAILGLFQWIKRRSLLKVDRDILLLGIYYCFIIGSYVFFEMVPLNYRPILIDGRIEASYPSSTTLLVLGVMPTLLFQMKRRCPSGPINKWVSRMIVLFSVLMVAARLWSGVHWMSDIVGAILLCFGFYCFYEASVL